MNTAPKTGLFYYGWWVLAASAVVEMLAIGGTSYGAGLFVLPLQAEFGLSRADASSSLLIMNFGAIFMAPFAGRSLDRYPIRIVIGIGVVCYCFAMALIALTASLKIMVVALLLPAALGFAILGPMTTATLASRWFFRRRGLALGIAAVATSGGGFFVVPLLSKAIETYGWRNALLAEAALYFVVITALALFVLAGNPFTAGLAEHAENKGRLDGPLLSQNSAARRDDGGSAMSGRQNILTRRGFWTPALLVAIISGFCQAIVVTAPPYGHQLAFSAASSALLISGFSIAAALTKIAVGVMSDIWEKKVLLFIAAGFMPLAMALLCWSTSYSAILAACCLAGMALGGVLPSSTALLAARFGTARFGSIMGWLYFLVFIATIAFVRFAGTMFDLTGTYHTAFIAFLGFSLFVWVAALLLDSGVRA